MVEQRRRRRKGALIVRVRFEPSRLAASCLADAYERVVAAVQRRSGRAIDAGWRSADGQRWKGVAR